MRLSGQTFTSEILERMRSVVSAEHGPGRSALSRRVCGWLGWRDAPGKPKNSLAEEASTADCHGRVELKRGFALDLPRTQADVYR